MRKLYLVLLTSAVFSVAKGQNLSEVQRSIMLEQYGKAREMVKALIAKNPKDPAPYYWMGEVLSVTGKKDSARQAFEESIRRDEKFALGYVGLGKLTITSAPSESKEKFDKALAISKSKDPQVLAFLAEAYNEPEIKAPDKALPLIENAISMDAKKARYYLIGGDAYLEKTYGSKAMEYYKKALSLQPNDGEAYMKIGNLYNRAKNYEEGLKYYKEGLEKDPSFVLLHRQIGDLYYKAGQYDKAIESYRKYMEKTDRTSDKDFRYASFLFLNKDYNSAIPIFLELKEKKYENPILFRLLAYSYYETGDYQKGMDYLNQYWKIAPQELHIAFDYEYNGKLHAKTGNDSLAIINFRKALQMDPSRTDLYVETGSLYFKGGKYRDAAEQFALKVQKSAATSQDYLYLGKAYYFDKNYAKADSVFGILNEKLPSSPTGYIWRARAKYNTDTAPDRAMAKPYYEKFIELTQSEPEKFKKELIDAYSYLGMYYSVNKDKEKSMENWNKVIALDPENKYARQALKK